MKQFKQKEETKEKYNSIPVFYCKHCNSLHIGSLMNQNICLKCGATNIGKCHIEEWKKLKEND